MRKSGNGDKRPERSTLRREPMEPCIRREALLATTFAGIVVGLGAAFMPQFFVPLMLGCYAFAALTLLLCWREIRELYRRLRRRDREIRLAGDFYFVLAMVFVEILIPTVALATHDWTDEDLRASFEMMPTARDKLKVTYILQNEGKHSAIVTGVALFDMMGRSQLDDPTKLIDACNKVSMPVLLIQETMGNLLRFEAISGVAGVVRRTNQIEGFPSPNASETLIVDSGKTQFVSAVFDIPMSRKDDDVRIFCPIVWTRSARSTSSVAICEGVSFSWSLGADLQQHPFTNRRMGLQFRLLPPPSAIPTCPRT